MTDPRYRVTSDGLVIDLITSLSVGRVEQLTPLRREGSKMSAARWVGIDASGIPIAAPTKLRAIAAMDVIREVDPGATLRDLVVTI